MCSEALRHAQKYLQKPVPFMLCRYFICFSIWFGGLAAHSGVFFFAALALLHKCAFTTFITDMQMPISSAPYGKFLL